MLKLASLLLFIYLLLLPQLSFARTTPEDISNQRRQVYETSRKNYSAQNKQKLDLYDRKVADLNRQITSELQQLMVRQGEIMDEYANRKGIPPVPETDGIKRNLEDPVENARYWITYAHEAVAYQAAKIYIPELTGQSNLKRDIVVNINSLQSDIGVLKGKVTKSQQTQESLLNK